MRENRMYGSEGGAAETNRPFLPLSLVFEVTSLGCKRMGRLPAVQQAVYSLRLARATRAASPRD
jgi:hypothetical protein